MANLLLSCACQIDTAAQAQRVRRTEAIAQDLVFAQVETEGGTQIMAVLILHAVLFWLAGIDPKRVREEIRPEILRHQREVVDVLYSWARSPKAMAASAGLVPMEQITKPYGTVYESLKAAFGVARYADIPDQDWPRVVQWFRTQLEPWRCVVQNLVRNTSFIEEKGGSMVSQKNFIKSRNRRLTILGRFAARTTTPISTFLTAW